MRRLCNHVIATHGSPEQDPELVERAQGKCLWVWSDAKVRMEHNKTERKLAFCCDLGVYTKNRQFRLWRSTKRKGTPRPLLLEGVDSAAASESLITWDNFTDLMIQRCTQQEIDHMIDVLEPDGRTTAHSTSDLRRFRLDAETLLGKTGARLDSSVLGTMALSVVPGKGATSSRTVLQTDKSERLMEVRVQRVHDRSFTNHISI